MANKTSADGRLEGAGIDCEKMDSVEISVVSVPADPTVGVGRQDEISSRQSFDLFERQLIVNQNKAGGK